MLVGSTVVMQLVALWKSSQQAYLTCTRTKSALGLAHACGSNTTDIPVITQDLCLPVLLCLQLWTWTMPWQHQQQHQPWRSRKQQWQLPPGAGWVVPLLGCCVWPGCAERQRQQRAEGQHHCGSQVGMCDNKMELRCMQDCCTHDLLRYEGGSRQHSGVNGAARYCQ